MKWLKHWKIVIYAFYDEEEVFRGMHKIESLISGSVREIDIPERIGITGVLCDSDGNWINGADYVEPMRVRKIERSHRRRRFFDSVYVMEWKLTKVKEIYKVYTNEGVYCIRVNDMSADTLVILNDLVDGVDSLEKFRVEPIRSFNI